VSRPVVFFIDYENVRYTPKHAFGCEPIDVSPIKLAQLIVARRKFASHIDQVRVYRGIARADVGDRRASSDMIRVNRWKKDVRVMPITRPLQYSWQDGVRTSFEKGIDVALAVDLIRLAHSSANVDAVVVSRDSDLNPALEAFVESDYLGRRIEVVSCKKMERLRLWNSNKPWCHYLTREDFERIRED
jgi:uncharacterized LabA/DUF88 family protein